MPHPFFKNASIVGLPTRLSNKLYERLKKSAHTVWEMENAGTGPVAVRKRPETAKLSAGSSDHPASHEVIDDSHDSVNVGDLVLLFMGGQKIAGRVVNASNSMLTVATSDGEIDNVPASWVRKADDRLPPQRTITREDIPAVDPSKIRQTQAPQMDPTQIKIVDMIKRELAKSGGRVGIRLNPQNILMITQNGNAIQCEVWHTSAEIVDRNNYQSLEHLVQSQGLSDLPSFVSQELTRFGLPGHA